jgi:hypothetical protein
MLGGRGIRADLDGVSELTLERVTNGPAKIGGAGLNHFVPVDSNAFAMLFDEQLLLGASDLGPRLG